MKVKVDEAKCIGCGMCQSMCPDCFEVTAGISRIKKDACEPCDLTEVAEACPVNAIAVEQDSEAPASENSKK